MPSKSLQSSIAAALIFPLAVAPVTLPAETPAAVEGRPPASLPLKGDDKLLLVLDRFTYGPRPGDLERLRAIGIQAWFDEQLVPRKIDDSALDRKLADYPAMQLPLNELMERYPNQQVIRKMMNGQTARPGGEAEKAIYADSIARYKEKLARKNDTDAAKSASSGDGDEAAPGSALLPKDAATLITLPPDQRFSALCKFTPQQLKALRQSAQPGERLQLVAGFTPQQMEALAAFATPAGVVAAEDVQTKLLRDIYSERQLNEVMTDFWLNHFNVYIKKSQDAPYYISVYARDSIRPYALGSFENLLIATATSPAMLNYLDNSSSIGPHSTFAQRPTRGFAQPKRQTGLNENYARELMELHTLGVNGGYTQADVTEVAKVFTGWTVGAPEGAGVFARERNGIPTEAQFDGNKHEPGKKTVLGVTIKDGGEKEGLQVLHLLATSPATARFISTKLAVRFVSDDPPKPMVDRMTQTFLTTHGDIRKVLLAMVNSPEFFTTSTYRAKVKTPQDFVLSAVRASGGEVVSAGALASVISDLGMPVYGMQTPNGYSMKADPWNNTASLVARLNFALALAANRVVGVRTDWPALLTPTQSAAATPPTDPAAFDPQKFDPRKFDPQEKERILESRLLHIEVSDRTRSAILAQITADPAQQEASLQQVAVKDRKRDPLAARAVEDRIGRAPIPDPQSALAAGLLFGSPEFQRR